MAKDLRSGHLKNLDISMSDGVDVKNTKMLDGEAQESAVMNESNSTNQYKTPNIPKERLGAKNNLDG